VEDLTVQVLKNVANLKISIFVVSKLEHVVEAVRFLFDSLKKVVVLKILVVVQL
jgi:hypothetical protein